MTGFERVFRQVKRRLARNLVIRQSPLAHEADAFGADAVDDEIGIVGRAEIATEERIGLPDGVEHCGVGEDFCDAGDADLVV
jgi:hypothetical protein